MSTNQSTRDTTSSRSDSHETKVEILISSPSEQVLADKATRIRACKLYRAAQTGKWTSEITKIFNDHPEYKTGRAKITKKEDTVLHIAAEAESSDFAKKLVEKMEEKDLDEKNKTGNTAFCVAAASGKLKLAKAMLEKKKDLANTRNQSNMSPLYMAALFGHKRMVLYLYNKTVFDSSKEEHKNDLIRLLHALINSRFYDVALKLVEDKKYQWLASATNEQKETALHPLSRMPIITSSNNEKGFWKRFVSLFSGTEEKRPPKTAVEELVKLLWNQVMDDDKFSGNIEDTARELVFNAAKRGNVKFLTTLIWEYPDLIFLYDKKNSIFHHAILNRCNDIYKLIYQIGRASRTTIVHFYDKDKRENVLHLTAKFPKSLKRRNNVSGAALQMQRELMWFEEVSKIAHPSDAEAENAHGKTPRDLFTEEHEDLKEEGEKWMKDTANYCMIVAALIATVVFAGAFTIPGGTKDTGAPNFLQKASFKIFVISDAISLVSSSCSILTFLSILTSRYKEEDFLRLLPRKLCVGLATLFLSIAAMMIVFCTTIFIVFKDGEIWVPILVTVIASLPAIFFTYQHFLLFVDVMRSTYGSSSLFKSSERTLFYEKKDKATKSKRE